LIALGALACLAAGWPAFAQPATQEPFSPLRALFWHWQGTADGQAGPVVPGLKPLAFLLGDWEAAPGSAGETGATSFRSSVQGRVIVRTNDATYPAANGKPASRHDDLMVIAAEGSTLRADYFDNEGHVIRYSVESPAAAQVSFVSDVKANEPRYRLRYSMNADGTLTGQFDIAPPGKPEDFTRYLTWSARRAR
jgi:hypothetical protein